MYHAAGITAEEETERDYQLRLREVVSTEKANKFNFWSEFMTAAAMAVGPIAVAYALTKWKGK